MQNTLNLVIIFLTSFLLPNFANAQEDDFFRIWRDSTNTFKVKAKLAGFDGITVKLLRDDGVVLEVPSAKLSKTDVEYLKKRQITHKPIDKIWEDIKNLRKDGNPTLSEILAVRMEMHNLLAKVLQSIRDVNLEDGMLEVLDVVEGMFEFTLILTSKTAPISNEEIAAFKSSVAFRGYSKAVLASNRQRDRVFAIKGMPFEVLEAASCPKLHKWNPGLLSGGLPESISIEIAKANIKGLKSVPEELINKTKTAAQLQAAYIRQFKERQAKLATDPVARLKADAEFRRRFDDQPDRTYRDILMAHVMEFAKLALEAGDVDGYKKWRSCIGAIKVRGTALEGTFGAQAEKDADMFIRDTPVDSLDTKID
tara:strand:+ start:117 stop:1217 length:1101 start_codon:yes stop_codon:yes gene_type:complete